MTKKKITLPAASQMSNQQITEAKFRALAQETKQNAQAMLYNLCQNPEAVKPCIKEDGTIDLSPLVKASTAAATTFMVEMGSVLGVLHEEIVTKEASKEE